MSQNVNNSPLSIGFDEADGDTSLPPMIEVSHVSMIFNMASQQLNSLKEYAIALARRELMFKEFRALDDVSFTVRKGDVFGILGTNGSGKSTILKIIAGVLEPSEGSCKVYGSIAPLIELGAGFDMELTARENIYLNGALLGYSRSFIDQHFDEIVDFAEVENFLDIPMKNYSSGMVARIAFAIATIIVPEVLIVDEVLSVGDFMFQQKCERRITELIKNHGVTVLIVSHNNDQIERLCNKAVWIEKGKMRMIGSAADVCGIYRVLGGHIGSSESEKRIFNLLVNSEPNMSLATRVVADSRYGLASRLAYECFGDVSQVILVSGNYDMDPILAIGLSGALNAPILYVDGQEIPDSTAQMLRQLQPSSILFINSGQVQQGVIAQSIHQVIGLDEGAVEELCSSRYEELSALVYEYGANKDAWGSSGVVSWVGCAGDLVTISPFLFKHHAPVFLKDANAAFDESLRDTMLRSCLKELVILADDPQFSIDEEASFNRAGFSTRRFVGEGPYDANRQIDEWLFENGLLGDVERNSWVVVSFPEVANSLLSGIYAAQNQGAVLLIDPGDLDSVSEAIDRIKAKSDEMRNLTIMGGRTTFTEADIALLSRAM